MGYGTALGKKVHSAREDEEGGTGILSSRIDLRAGGKWAWDRNIGCGLPRGLSQF